MSKRIAIVTEIPTPYRDPVFDLLTRTDDYTYELFYLSSRQADRDWQLPNSHLLKTTFLESFECALPKTHAFYVSRNVKRELISPNFDGYILGGYAQPAFYSVLSHCWKQNRPYVMMTESHLRKSRAPWIQQLKRPYVRKVYERGVANLVTSSLAREYVESFGANPNTIFLFPNSVDGPAFLKRIRERQDEIKQLKRNLRLEGKKTILFVGALHPRKGICTLLNAFSKIETDCPNTTLLWVGNGPLKKEIQKYRSNIVIGFVQPDLLPAYYGLADLFVLPSIDEPFGAVICEAASAGLPIITTSSVGASVDFVQEGKNGFIIPPNDENALAERLKNILKNDDLQKAMSAHSEKVMSSWTHRFLADQFMLASKAAFQ